MKPIEKVAFTTICTIVFFYAVYSFTSSADPIHGKKNNSEFDQKKKKKLLQKKKSRTLKTSSTKKNNGINEVKYNKKEVETIKTEENLNKEVKVASPIKNQDVDQFINSILSPPIKKVVEKTMVEKTIVKKTMVEKSHINVTGVTSITEIAPSVSTPVYSAALKDNFEEASEFLYYRHVFMNNILSVTPIETLPDTVCVSKEEAELLTELLNPIDITDQNSKVLIEESDVKKNQLEEVQQIINLMDEDEFLYYRHVFMNSNLEVAPKVMVITVETEAIEDFVDNSKPFSTVVAAKSPVKIDDVKISNPTLNDCTNNLMSTPEQKNYSSLYEKNFYNTDYLMHIDSCKYELEREDSSIVLQLNNKESVETLVNDDKIALNHKASETTLYEVETSEKCKDYKDFLYENVRENELIVNYLSVNKVNFSPEPLVDYNKASLDGEDKYSKRLDTVSPRVCEISEADTLLNGINSPQKSVASSDTNEFDTTCNWADMVEEELVSELTKSQSFDKHHETYKEENMEKQPANLDWAVEEEKIEDKIAENLTTNRKNEINKSETTLIKATEINTSESTNPAEIKTSESRNPTEINKTEIIPSLTTKVNNSKPVETSTKKKKKIPIQYNSFSDAVKNKVPVALSDSSNKESLAAVSKSEVLSKKETPLNVNASVFVPEFVPVFQPDYSTVNTLEYNTPSYNTPEYITSEYPSGYNSPDYGSGYNAPDYTIAYNQTEYMSGYTTPEYASGYTTPEYASGYITPEYTVGYDTSEFAPGFNTPPEFNTPDFSSGPNTPPEFNLNYDTQQDYNTSQPLEEKQIIPAEIVPTDSLYFTADGWVQPYKVGGAEFYFPTTLSIKKNEVIKDEDDDADTETTKYLAKGRNKIRNKDVKRKSNILPKKNTKEAGQLNLGDIILAKITESEKQDKKNKLENMQNEIKKEAKSNSVQIETEVRAESRICLERECVSEKAGAENYLKFLKSSSLNKNCVDRQYCQIKDTCPFFHPTKPCR